MDGPAAWTWIENPLGIKLETNLSNTLEPDTRLGRYLFFHATRIPINQSSICAALYYCVAQH